MYPLKMTPVFKDYLWGGERLVNDYGKRTTLRPVAESWELSTHPDGESIVANGPLAGKTLSAVLRENPAWIGCGRESLPVLAKLIDAKQKLSLQVHPATGPEPKNEMWYVLDAEPGAELILGLREPLAKQELARAVGDGSILDAARRVAVQKGDCFCVPAGMIHAIGEGLLIAEVQQCSNITYRVNDYGRLGPDGKPRALHTREAVDVSDTSLETRNAAANPRVPRDGYSETVLADWVFFSCSLLQIETAARLDVGPASGRCVLIVSGTATLRAAGCQTALVQLETAFLPAGIGACDILGPCEILCTSFGI